MNDTNTAGREALQEYLKDCDAHAIVPDVGGAWHAAFQAGRASLAPSGFDAADMATASAQGFRDGVASLAASAGSEPVALDPRHIRKFLQALQAGEMSVARAVEILDAWLEGRYSDDMVPPPPADSCLIANDEFPMEIVRKLRSEMATHPYPPEGMAGWKWVPVEPTDEMLAAAHDGDREYTLRNFGDVMTVMQGPYDHWAAMIAAAPPIPASETKDTP